MWARHCQYPYPYIAACVDKGDRQGAGISATMIATDCIRKSVLDSRIDYPQYPHELQASMKGTAQHAYFERFNEDGILAEVRLVKKMPSGRYISGQIDRYLAWCHRIEDYKFKSEKTLPTKPPLNYVGQQNIYRYMLETGCTILSTGEMIPPQEPITELALYPSNHMDWGELRCPIWQLTRVEWFIEQMLDIFDAAKDPSYVPPRQYTQPETTNFCKNWCPIWRQCCTLGGETRDLFVEALSEH
jgi:hypothetical protein